MTKRRSRQHDTVATVIRASHTRPAALTIVYDGFNADQIRTLERHGSLIVGLTPLSIASLGLYFHDETLDPAMVSSRSEYHQASIGLGSRFFHVRDQDNQRHYLIHEFSHLWLLRTREFFDSLRTLLTKTMTPELSVFSSDAFARAVEYDADQLSRAIEAGVFSRAIVARKDIGRKD